VDEDGVMTVIIDDEISVHHESEVRGTSRSMGVLPLQKQVPEAENLPQEQ
jgi:hypothetical protein